MLESCIAQSYQWPRPTNMVNNNGTEYTPYKKKNALMWGIQISNLVDIIDKIFVGSTFWYLIFYTDHKLSMFDAMYEKWRMPVINPIDHCGTMPSQTGMGYSTPIQWGLFDCSVHGNDVTVNIPMWYFSFETFWIGSFFINRHQKSLWTIYDLWRKMRYQNVDETIGQFHKGLCKLCHHTITRLIIQTPHMSVDFLFLRCVYETILWEHYLGLHGYTIQDSQLPIA